MTGAPAVDERLLWPDTAIKEEMFRTGPKNTEQTLDKLIQANSDRSMCPKVDHLDKATAVSTTGSNDEERVHSVKVAMEMGADSTERNPLRLQTILLVTGLDAGIQLESAKYHREAARVNMMSLATVKTMLNTMNTESFVEVVAEGGVVGSLVTNMAKLTMNTDYESRTGTLAANGQLLALGHLGVVAKFTVSCPAVNPKQDLKSVDTLPSGTGGTEIREDVPDPSSSGRVNSQAIMVATQHGHCTAEDSTSGSLYHTEMYGTDWSLDSAG